MKCKKIAAYISVNIAVVVVIIIGTGFPKTTLAAPAITSASISGNTITVSGSGFGSHSDWGGSQTFLNKAWSNFDTGNLNGGNLGIGAYPENWSVQTSANRNNSSFYAEKRAVNGELGSLSADQSGSPTEWYISFWFRMPPNTQAGKFLRIYGGSYNIYLSTGCDDTMIRAYCEGCGGATQWDSAVSFGNSAWKKFEFLMDENPLTATTWINGVEGWSRPDLTHVGWGANGHTIDIGNMIDDASRGCGTAGAYQYDDVFINHTRARVEISTASTYSLTANREPQLPTAWSSSSISAQLNRSGYADGTYYLYVIDSTGAVNSTGYPITIGSGGGDTTPPTSPTNLVATSPSQSSISVSWTASTDNVGVANYIVERCQGSGCSNFAQVGTPTASPFVDSSLTANTFYNYHVRARDAANNLSGWSNVVGATTQSATPVTTLTIDNTDAATSQSGSWSPSTNFPGYYGTNYHYSPNATGHWFEWTASTLSPGTYEVSAYWNANPDRPTDVSYLITHSGGTATRNNINQTQNGSQWNLLGTYTFGTTGTVRVQSGGTGTEGTVADAIRFVKTNTVACNTVTTANFSQAAYNSYGAPFDAFQTSTNLMDAKCNSADTHTINLTTGVTGDTTRIVYTKGYWYDAVTTAWRQYTGTCTGALNGEWCQGSVSATITDANVSTASASNPTYLVGMTCSVQGGSWKCGCRDTACSNFSWQIQGAGL